jgi:DNA-binding transcriptional regulator YiaG/uncharacterized phage-associated protein
MKSPFTGKEMAIVKEWRTMSFRKEEFKVLFHAYRCEDTGEQFEDDVLAQLNYNQLVNQYREKYSIPFPEQIASIREKYEVSAARMSEVLGFGVNSYRQYEAGEVPNQSNARLIQLVEDPHEFRKLLSLYSTIEPKSVAKIHHRIDFLLDEQKKHKFIWQLEDYLFGKCLPNSLTGYRLPNLLKFTEMIIYFSETLKPWKTKLNKLLFYADFLMYKQSGYSISGVQYRAIPMGPVPNNFQSIFEHLANKGEFEVYYTTFHDGGTGEQFISHENRKFNPGLFSKDELMVLEAVVERFKNISTKEIIDISHNEKAWMENEKEKRLIDYGYGFELN